jgi:O-antigen/teichoic acid export membrane protein
MFNFLKILKNLIISLKGLAIIGSADVLGMGVSAGFWLIIALIMSVKEYGEITYLIAISSIAFSLSIIGTPNSIFVFSSKYPKAIPSLMILSLIFASISSLIIFLLFQKFELIFLVFGFLFFDISIQILLGKKLYKKYSFFSLSQKVLQFILGISLFLILGFDGVLYGIILSQIPILIIF